MTKILALDLASTTGWAAGHPGEVPTFGAQRFAPPTSARGLVYRRFRLWINSMLVRHQPTMLVYESPMAAMMLLGKTNVHTLRLLVGMAEHLEELAHDRIELSEVTVSKVRSHFIGGNYRAKIAKPMVLERCRSMGWACESTDEADACALWDYVCCLVRPELATATTPLFSKA